MPVFWFSLDHEKTLIFSGYCSERQAVSAVLRCDSVQKWPKIGKLVQIVSALLLRLPSWQHLGYFGLGCWCFWSLDWPFRFRSFPARSLLLHCCRPTRGNGDHMDRFIEYIIHNILNPSFAWVLNHPIISVVAVGALIYFSVRNYRML